MSRTKEELDNLKNRDVYSLILFALFKIKDIPEYSTLSELVYILDKDNLLKLCTYFGGLTIKIPTKEELESMVYSLLLYQYVDIDGMEYNDAVKLIGFDQTELRQAKSNYMKLSEILNAYDFNRGE